MRKLLHILMLSALFVSCSSDENRIIDDGGNSMIDEKIIGKWKVEYSKTIKGAKLSDDGVIEVADNAIITEYDGKTSSEIKSYIFRDWERVIEFTDSNKLYVYDIGENGSLLNKDNSAYKYSVYKVKGNVIEWENSRGQIGIIPREYSLKDNELIIQIKPTILTGYIYVISKYSKITE